MAPSVTLPLIGDFFASIAPGYLTFGVGVAFAFTKFLKPDFSFAFASYAFYVGLPAIVFKKLALDDPFAFDLKLLGADAISKFIPLFLLLLWWRFFSNYGKRESFEWVIVFFVLSTFPNTVLIGEALLSPMFGTWVNTETKDIEFAQAFYWYSFIIMLLEIREIMLEDEQMKSPLPVVLAPGWKAKNKYFGKQDLSLFNPKAIETDCSSDGQRSLVRRLCHSINKFLFNPRTDDANAQINHVAASKHVSADGRRRASLDSSGSSMRNLLHSTSKVGPSSQIDGAGAQVDHTFELSKPGGSAGKDDAAGHEQQPTEAASVVEKPKANHDASHDWYTVDLDHPSLLEADKEKKFPKNVIAADTCSVYSAQLDYDQEKRPRIEVNAAAAKSSWPGYDDFRKPSVSVYPPSTDWSWPGYKVAAYQVFRLVKRMLKLPITYASLLGFVFALIAFHKKFALPHFLESTFDLLGCGTIGMSFVLLGMTFANNIVDGRGIIPCGTKLLLAGFAVRFIAAPIIMYISSEIVHIRGNLLIYAIVQVLVPQGTVAFSLAMFYDFKPCIMGTAIYTQMLVFIPISLAYYAVLEAI